MVAAFALSACGDGGSTLTSEGQDGSNGSFEAQPAETARRTAAGWAATADSLWVGGGLLDNRGTLTADSSFVRITPDGSVAERREVALAEGEFVDVRSISPIGDALRVFAVRCRIGSSSTPGCALEGRMASVITIASDGTSSAVDVEGLVPSEMTDQQVGIRVLDASADAVLLARFSNVRVSDSFAPQVDVEILRVDLASGEIATVGRPPGPINNEEVLCAADGLLVALVAPEPSSGPARSAALHVASTDADQLEWRRAAAIAVDPGAVPPAALCGANGAVVVSATSPAGVVASYLSVNAEPPAITQQRMSLRAWHLADGGEHHIVTELGPAGGGAWEIDPRSGEWRDAGRFELSDSDLPYVIRFGGRLVNIGSLLAAPISGDSVSLEEVGP